MHAIETLEKTAASGSELPGLPGGCKAYPASVHKLDGTLFFIARSAEERFLVAAGEPALELFAGEACQCGGVPAKRCPLTYGNAKALMGLFPFTAPASHKGHAFTMGLGDRLGLAAPGHIRTVRGRGVFPVLAQQSMRELKLTGRTYEDVLAAAVFAVFQEDWRGGWGADGDHLKTADEIRYALRCGYTMITLDCSDQIGKQAQGLEGSALDAAYAALPQDVRSHYETTYMGKSFGHGRISIDRDELKAIALTYGRAIGYAADIYHNVVANCGRPVDFEVSIDETLSKTTPAAHYVVAQELTDQGVKMASMAPRFVGEFQKGIDYIGDAAQFEKDFIAHAEIAKSFGYRLSIHSGSDKFAVFGIIGKHTNLNVHVKTAGTNWLEALRVVAQSDPALFRELLAFAMEHLEEARAYYHIGADPARVALPGGVPDSRLATYLDSPDSRQILHITYGLILQAADPDGKPLFSDRLFRLLRGQEDRYAGALQRHIGRHIDALMG